MWWDGRFAGLKSAAKTVIKNKSDKPKAPPRPELPRSEAAITLATTLSGGHRLTAVAAFKQPPSSSGRVPCTLTLAPKLPASVQALVPGDGLSLSGVYATSGSKATLKAAWKLALPKPPASPAATGGAGAEGGGGLSAEQAWGAAAQQESIAAVIEGLPARRLPALAWAVLRRDSGAAEALAAPLAEGALRVPSVHEAAAAAAGGLRYLGFSSADLAWSVSYVGTTQQCPSNSAPQRPL